MAEGQEVDMRTECFFAGKIYFSAKITRRNGKVFYFIGSSDGEYKKYYRKPKFDNPFLMLYAYFGWQWNPLNLKS